jgi:hypothetical protein
MTMVDLANLLTLPLRLTVRALRIGVTIANEIVELASRDGDSATVTVTREQPAATRPPPPARPKPAPEPEPYARTAPIHVSEEPELVEEFADEGAEEPPGPEISVAEPWTGYRRMTAPEVVDRVASATREELAVVELYEATHRKRKTVLAAADRRLKELSPPVG